LLSAQGTLGPLVSIPVNLKRFYLQHTMKAQRGMG